MRNPFPGNPVFEQFLGLKGYFKKYQTRASYNRVRVLAKAAKIIHSAGDEIAFDFLGSVNFGMAEEKSDVDLVVYLKCPELKPDEEMNHSNCPRLKFYELMVIQTLVHSFSKENYTLQVVDYINLHSLGHAIENNDKNSDILARFVFYRTLCRGVNKRVLHPYEKLLKDKPHLFHSVESALTDALIEFTRTSSHEKSFQKYLKRLEDGNIHIPESVLQKVGEYLDLSKLNNQRS